MFVVYSVLKLGPFEHKFLYNSVSQSNLQGLQTNFTFFSRTHFLAQMSQVPILLVCVVQVSGGRKEQRRSGLGDAILNDLHKACITFGF